MERPEIHVHLHTGDVLYIKEFDVWDWRIHNGVERLIVKMETGLRKEIPAQNIRQVEVYTKAYGDED